MPTNMHLLQEDADKPSAADEGYPKIRNKGFPGSSTQLLIITSVKEGHLHLILLQHT